MSQKPKFQKILLFAVVLGGLLLALPLLLPVALPFLIGLGAALAAEPFVRVLQKKTGLPRGGCTFLCVGALLLLCGTALYFLLRVLLGELEDLSAQLPTLLAQLEAPAARLQAWLDTLVSRLPQRSAQSLRTQLSSLFDSSSYLMQSLSRGAMGLASGLLSKMPGTLIGTVTALLAAFFISSSLPELKILLQKKLPKARFEKFCLFRRRIRETLGGWLLAQLELSGIACVILCAGLAILRVDYWLLLGVVIALIDALPVLGAGVVLIPWALFAFLQENSALGIGLLVVYGCVWVLRTALSPKLVGNRVGLPPLASLASFYVGWRLFGAAGMVLLPVGTVLAWQIFTLLRQEQPNLRAAQTPEKAQ